MYNIGDVVTLNTAMLGCNPGTRGVVFNSYTDFDNPAETGVQIIFENGEYDGFSASDQNTFLEPENVEYIPFYIRDYKFENVMKVTRDFVNGFWDEIFN